MPAMAAAAMMATKNRNTKDILFSLTSQNEA
jgi:hypothetical protein